MTGKSCSNAGTRLLLFAYGSFSTCAGFQVLSKKEMVSAAILKRDSVLKALRNWRGSTQVQRAQAAGIARGFLSELEARMKTGSAETLAKLAQRLDVPVGWLG